MRTYVEAFAGHCENGEANMYAEGRGGTRSVNLRFDGGALPMFGRALLAIVCSILIVPAAWGSVPYIRWLVEQIDFGDGERATFEGRPGDVWYLFSASAVIGFIPAIVQRGVSDAFVVVLAANLVTAALSVFIAIRVFKWVVANTRIGRISDLSFDGEYLPYLGFVVGIQLAAYTIVGWAWVTTAFQRWLLGHIRSQEAQFQFVGSGLGFLWRAVVTGLACLFVIPIPWVLRWLTAWFVENTVIQRAAYADPGTNPYGGWQQENPYGLPQPDPRGAWDQQPGSESSGWQQPPS